MKEKHTKTPGQCLKSTNNSTVVKNNDSAKLNCNQPLRENIEPIIEIESVKTCLFKPINVEQNRDKSVIIEEEIPSVENHKPAFDIVDAKTKQNNQSEVGIAKNQTNNNNIKSNKVIKRHLVAVPAVQQNNVSTFRQRIANYAEKLNTNKATSMPRKISKPEPGIKQTQPEITVNNNKEPKIQEQPKTEVKHPPKIAVSNRIY